MAEAAKKASDRRVYERRKPSRPVTASNSASELGRVRSERRAPMSNATNKPGIVFAHGLWADGSCFQKLIPTLQADGHEVICSQHGLDSLKGDVDSVIRCIGRVSGPVVLVG